MFHAREPDAHRDLADFADVRQGPGEVLGQRLHPSTVVFLHLGGRHENVVAPVQELVSLRHLPFQPVFSPAQKLPAPPAAARGLRRDSLPARESTRPTLGGLPECSRFESEELLHLYKVREAYLERNLFTLMRSCRLALWDARIENQRQLLCSLEFRCTQ